MADKKKYPYGSAMLGGKEVPFTKSGLPNRVYLTKEGKATLTVFSDKLKATKKAASQKELSDLLNSLV